MNTVYTPARKVGATTASTATGGAVGASLAQLLVHFVPTLESVEGALTVLIGAALAVAAGYFVKPDPVVDAVIADEVEAVPDASPGDDE